MGIRIEMFGFKSGAGYQLDRHKQEERLYDRYNLRDEKAKEQKKKNEQNLCDRITFSDELQKALGRTK